MDSSEECNNVYFSVRRDLLSLYFFKNTRTFYLINLITALFPIFFFFLGQKYSIVQLLRHFWEQRGTQRVEKVQNNIARSI